MNPSDITFFAPGIPSAQGSKRHVGNGIMVDTDKNLKSWRSVVAGACPLEAPLNCPVEVSIVFCYNRPKSHYGRRDKKPYLKDDAPYFKSSAPDVDKLMRAVCDALTGIAYVDDALIARLSASKIYIDQLAGARITIAPLKNP